MTYVGYIINLGTLQTFYGATHPTSQISERPKEVSSGAS
jgi:hypothetical protein